MGKNEGGIIYSRGMYNFYLIFNSLAKIDSSEKSDEKLTKIFF